MSRTATSTTDTARLQRVRRRAARRDEIVWKVREDASGEQYVIYGPYAVIDNKTHGFVETNATLDDLEKRYA